MKWSSAGFNCLFIRAATPLRTIKFNTVGLAFRTSASTCSAFSSWTVFDQPLAVGGEGVGVALVRRYRPIEKLLSLFPHFGSSWLSCSYISDADTSGFGRFLSILLAATNSS